MCEQLVALCPSTAVVSPPSLWRRLFAQQPAPDCWACVGPEAGSRRYEDEGIVLAWDDCESDDGREDQLLIEIHNRRSFPLHLHCLLLLVHYGDEDVTVDSHPPTATARLRLRPSLTSPALLR